ncbi:hypothetical protein HNP84_004898 [Thermocatellispora tengchongensis]|uniref:Spore-associated protein A n=1 Tax=Thermocatellispora tengchongensis TaxID=1073253 RepID=A0A840P768_9ACTN|nr:hypothetical protein [Thermocatellispora tengchongensis]MBB5135162.1 hypothetical protein [Thermocatellispora tengchongensis]
MRIATKGVAVAVALAGGLALTPAGAVSAAVGYTPEGICGAGFSRVSDGSRAVKAGRDVYGRIYLLYNRRTGYNCVTLIKSAFTRTKTWTSATLSVQGGRTETDEGQFKYYAGPVRLPARDACVKYWGATRDTRLDFTEATGGRRTWGNCH